MEPKTIVDLSHALREGHISPEDVVDALERDESRHISELESNVVIEPLETGIWAIDKFNLFKKTIPELVVCGARPGVGKTALMLQIAAHVAKEGDVLFFSLEMRENVMFSRTVSLVAEKPSSIVAKNPLLMADAKRKIQELKLRVVSEHHMDIADIRRKARNWARGKTPKMVVVDYIQIVGCSTLRSRTEEVKEIVLQLRQMAAELNCTVFTASQLNRSPDSRGKTKGAGYGDFTPLLSDLSESDSVGKDSDVVFFLNRQNNESNLLGTETDLVVSKNRAGATGSEKMEFSESMTRFISQRTL